MSTKAKKGRNHVHNDHAMDPPPQVWLDALRLAVLEGWPKDDLRLIAEGKVIPVFGPDAEHLSGYSKP